MNIEHIQKNERKKNSTREEKKSTKNNQRQCNNAQRARATTELPKKTRPKQIKRVLNVTRKNKFESVDDRRGLFR